MKLRHEICIKALVLSFAMRRVRIAMTEALLQSGSATTPQATLLLSPWRLDVEPISQYGIEEGKFYQKKSDHAIKLNGKLHPVRALQ